MNLGFFILQAGIKLNWSIDSNNFYDYLPKAFPTPLK